MKLISAAITLLASAAVVSSSPLYNYSDISAPTFDHDNLYNDLPTEISSSWWPTGPTPDSFPTGTIPDSFPTGTVETADDSDCAGFKITSQTEADITYSEDSYQEVTFDFTGSKLELVEYVDLVRFDDKAVVDEWATGPYYPNNSQTGLHEVHLHHTDAGYFQFLVVAATKEDHHCKYYSNKFYIKSNDSVPSQSSESPAAYAAHLQATATPDYYSPDTTTDSSYPTPSSSSYSGQRDSKSSDTDGLVSLFDSIVANLWKLSSEGDGSWQSHIKMIEDDFQTIKTDIETGNTSGDSWINDVEKLEKDLDYIKTSGTGQWTDHISSLELVLDQLKGDAWDDTFSALVKELASDGLTSISSYTTSSYSTSSYTSTDYPTYAAYYEASSSSSYEEPSSSSYEEPSSSSYEEPSSTSNEAAAPVLTPSYYDP